MSNQLLAGFLTSIFLLLLVGVSQGQPCTGVLNNNPPNPPMCQPPGTIFKVLLVIDESGSIGNEPGGFEDEVEDGVLKFAEALAGKPMELGIVEFNTIATIVLPLTNASGGGFVEGVKAYLRGDKATPVVNPNYNPGGFTNFVDALTKAKSIVDANVAGNDVDIIFFISDGNPEPPVPITDWKNLSDAIKTSGTYIFGIAVGSAPIDCNIRRLSGPDELNNPLGFQQGADWTRTNFDILAADLVDFANSLIDTHAPTIACSGNIRLGNETGKCGKVVNYVTTAEDDCVNVNLVCTPPPGSFFNVGQTIVSCKATDDVGNASTCTFKVTILDSEAPRITCPADKLISCEESSLPANTGSPVANDNCGIGSVSHADVRVDGSCPNEFTINRTWTAVDVHGNPNACLQVISVQDKKPPVITCPANVTVTCDISIPKTGSANANDNCDPSVSITSNDIHISGDCEWLCVTERHWKATDDCGNTSKCVQVVTKDVTPLIEQALASGPLVWGQTAATVTLPPGRGACVVQWLPYTGVVPTALKFDDAVAGVDCRLMSNPLDAGHIVNPLLGEAMKLKILVRLNPALGTKKLSEILPANTPPCTMHFIVRQALAGGENATVNELLRVTDLTLGNVNVNLLVPEHCLELLKVLKCVNAGRTVCNNP